MTTSEPANPLPASSKVLCTRYLVGGLAIAISATFPLFLIAREVRIGRTREACLGAVVG
jgi:hypothetical protein